MSCYRFYLDGVEVETPDGFDGMVFKRERHAVFFGFLHSGIGYGEVSDLTFTGETAVGILQAAWHVASVQAQVKVQIETNNQIVFDGLIDFSTAKVYSTHVSCTLKTQKPAKDFLTNAASSLMVTPVDQVILPDRPDSAIASHEIAPDWNIIQYGGITEADPSHYPVWESTKVGYTFPDAFMGIVAEKTGLGWNTVPTPYRKYSPQGLPMHERDYAVAYNVSGFKIEDTDVIRDEITVKVVGFIHVKASSSAGGRAEFALTSMRATEYLNPAKDVRTHVSIQTIDLTQQEQEFRIFFEEKITLSAVGMITTTRGLFFQTLVDTPSTNFKFDYMADCFLSVEIWSDKKAQPAAPLFYRADHLLQHLVKENTGQLAHVDLGLPPGDMAFISSGKNIRGLSTDFAVSFESLYKGLDCLFNLGVEYMEILFRIHPKQKLTSRGLAFPLTQILDMYQLPNERWTFSRVLAGYKEWQAESPFGLDEYNSTREYATGITAIEKELDIRSELIASSYIIQEGRSRIGTDSAREDWSFDEKLFIVIARYDQSSGMYRAITGSELDYNVLNGSLAVNATIRPTENVKRWLPIASASGNLTFKAGEGNLRAVVNDEHEDRSFSRTPTYFTSKALRISATLSLEEYAVVADRIWLRTESGEIEAIVHGIEYRPDGDGSGIAEITAYLI